MRTVILVVATTLSLAASAHAAALGFICEGDSLRVSVFLSGEFQDPTGIVANIRASVIGDCTPAVVVNAAPIPYPAFMTHSTVELMVAAIDPTRYMHLELFGVYPGGQEFAVGDSGDALHYDYGACGTDVIFGRGRIEAWPGMGYLLAPCEDHCWIGMTLLFDHSEPGWEAYVDSGTIVNIYGDAYVDGMPGGTYFSVTHVTPELDPAGCEALASAVQSWGTVKAMFR